MFPIRLGSPSDFSAVKSFLANAEYNEQSACKRLGLDRLDQYLGRREKPPSPASTECRDTLDALLAVFFVGNYVSQDLVRGFPGAIRESMEALGILCADAAQPDLCYSPVALYPIEGLYFVSDR